MRDNVCADFNIAHADGSLVRSEATDASDLSDKATYVANFDCVPTFAPTSASPTTPAPTAAWNEQKLQTETVVGDPSKCYMAFFLLELAIPTAESVSCQAVGTLVIQVEIGTLGTCDTVV